MVCEILEFHLFVFFVVRILSSYYPTACESGLSTAAWQIQKGKLGYTLCELILQWKVKWDRLAC